MRERKAQHVVSNDVVTELSRSPVLPRLDAVAARALNRLYGRVPPLALSLQGTDYELHWCLDGTTPAALHTYRFRFGTQTGHLGLDGPAQAMLLGERRAELLPRDLRYILLADALAPLANRLEEALRRRFEWAPLDAAEGPVAHDPQHAAHFRLAKAGDAWGCGGWVQFNEPGALGELLSALPPTAFVHRHSLEWLRVPLSFTVGSTGIRLHEVGSISKGDIIGIENWSSSGSALVVTAELGGPAGRHLVGWAEGSRITLQQLREPDMTQHTTATDAAEQQEGQLPLDRLDALEVTLRFEVGELSVSLGELRGVCAGHVFELGQELNRSPVRILAHGNVLGKGYLVAVGDRLGVRVTEFAPSAL